MMTWQNKTPPGANRTVSHHRPAPLHTFSPAELRDYLIGACFAIPGAVTTCKLFVRSPPAAAGPTLHQVIQHLLPSLMP
ncbi:MAG: hypothetical protein V4819_20720 [Verrucomicrobiota bacterium]